MTRVVLALLGLLLPAVAAADPSAALEVSPTAELETGDAIVATLTVPAEEDAHLTLAPFELEGIGVRANHGPRYDADRAAHLFRLELVALEPGGRWIGPFTVQIHHGGRTDEVVVPQKMVDVASVLVGAESLEPKPPSEPLPIVEPDSRVIVLVYVVLVALFFAAAGALLARVLAKRRAARRPPPPPRPPWEIALEALARLREERDRGLDEAGVEAWADAVSDVVREYLGARYGFDGLESTTDELVASLHAREPSDARLEVVRAFLRECDLVKFAKARLELHELDRLLDAATRIVHETRGFTPEAAA